MSGIILPQGVADPRVPTARQDRKKVKRAGSVDVKQQEANAEVDILPSELEELRNAALEIQRKFLHKPATHATLDAVEDSIKNRFAQVGRVGFKVSVGFEPMMNKVGDAAFLPTVTVEGRLEEEFDHDAMSHEVQHGKLDGVVGKMTMDGKLVDPRIVL